MSFGFVLSFSEGCRINRLKPAMPLPVRVYPSSCRLLNVQSLRGVDYFLASFGIIRDIRMVKMRPCYFIGYRTNLIQLIIINGSINTALRQFCERVYSPCVPFESEQLSNDHNSEHLQKTKQPIELL